MFVKAYNIFEGSYDRSKKVDEYVSKVMVQEGSTQRQNKNQELPKKNQHNKKRTHKNMYDYLLTGRILTLSISNTLPPCTVLLIEFFIRRLLCLDQR